MSTFNVYESKRWETARNEMELRVVELRKKRIACYEKDNNTRLKNIERIMIEVNSQRAEIAAAETEISLINAGGRDDELKTEILKNGLQVVTENTKTNPPAPTVISENKNKTRQTIKRKHLSEVLKSPSDFRIIINYNVWGASSKDGHSFEDKKNGVSFRSLNEWITSVLTAQFGKNSTNISVYDERRGVQIYLKSSESWVFMAHAHTENTDSIN